MDVKYPYLIWTVECSSIFHGLFLSIQGNWYFCTLSAKNNVVLDTVTANSSRFLWLLAILMTISEAWWISRRVMVPESTGSFPNDLTTSLSDRACLPTCDFANMLCDSVRVFSRIRTTTRSPHLWTAQRPKLRSPWDWSRGETNVMPFSPREAIIAGSSSERFETSCSGISPPFSSLTSI